jgi:3-oxoacyl-[acyl-carrier-protein] synthase II
MSARVVVTGMGAVTPLGPDFPTTWRRIVAGENAAAPVTLFDVAGCRCKQAATASLPAIPDLTSKQISRLSRGSRLALPAAREALKGAGLLDNRGRLLLPHLPISVSTTGGGMALGEHFLRAMLEQRYETGQFYNISRYQAQNQVHDLQEHIGFHGSMTIIANACASGANAIGHGADLIRSGACDCVLVGGYEALTELIYVGFDCLQAMSTDRCRPFDMARSGLMLGEAAAFAVLESDTHARERGARILCELGGYGQATDLHHLTQPHPAGAPAVTVMRQALAEAGCCADDIGYVNAHGTGTPLNDASEGMAFRTVFADGDTIPSRVRISSTKAAIGHALGAAGSIEALFAIAALQSGELPPNLNVRQAEPIVAANLVAVGERAEEMRATLSVNLGFGGSNAALVFKRYEQHAPVAAIYERQQPSLQQIAICGMGATLPAETPQRMKGLNAVSGEHVVRRVDRTIEPLTTLQNEARARRASPITLFMLAAAQQALGSNNDVRRERLGIVAAFNTGAVVSTRRFFEGIVKNGQRFASPNIFPETVFNSPTSHVAAVLGVAGPCYSLVGDDTAWVDAIRVAMTWLTTGLVDHALVIGAEELDAVAIDAYQRAGWLSPPSRTGYVPSEGAGALLLRRAGTGNELRIRQIASGFTYRQRSAALSSARACLAQFPADARRCRTAPHNWFGRIEEQLHGGKPVTLPYRGDAFVASAAWNTIAAAEMAQREGHSILLPVWGLSGQCSALLLGSG